MVRMDENMPFLLQYENVAWYENGKVRILDRRIYPTEVRFVECVTYQEVVQAIADMVTQSAGPYTAVGMGMALAAWQVRDKGTAEQDAFLQQAAYDLAHARPTTANRYGQITYRCAEVAKEALAAGKDPVQAIVENTVESLNRRYSTMQIVGDHLAELIPQGGTILTQCFGETIIGTVIRAARRQNKDFKVFCAETRPYLQGARLTSGCFAQMGFDTTVITDNMVAYAMEREGIDLFTSAADTSPGTVTSPTRSAPSRWRFWPSILVFRITSPASPIRTSTVRMTSSSRCGTPSRSSAIGASPTPCRRSRPSIPPSTWCRLTSFPVWSRIKVSMCPDS